MSEKLRNAGYNVIEAADGNDGLKKIQKGIAGFNFA